MGAYGSAALGTLGSRRRGVRTSDSLRNVLLPVRFVKGGWPAWLGRCAARFMWDDPRVVVDEAASPAEFRAAMSAFHLGGTFKITGQGRHPLADELLIRHVALQGAALV